MSWLTQKQMEPSFVEKALLALNHLHPNIKSHASAVFTVDKDGTTVAVVPNDENGKGASIYYRCGEWKKK